MSRLCSFLVVPKLSLLLEAEHKFPVVSDFYTFRIQSSEQNKPDFFDIWLDACVMDLVININMNTKVPWLASGFEHDMPRTPHNYKINNLENMIDPGW